ncbi:MAG TPA: PIN domain-containing protein [Solirubrobacteraceae bacterium]|jgi:predicted nucleic acid-binding protein
MSVVRLFVDSSAFFAVLDRGDEDHRRATAILSGENRLITTDHVLVESWRLARQRLGRNVAERFWGAVRGGQATVETVLPSDLDAARRIGELFADQDFSIVDRTSFAVMERLGISSVATFDDHFAIYRYGPRRERAFDVRR